MIDDKQYPTSPLGAFDHGGPDRVEPCSKMTWCYLTRDHEGPCEEIPRKPYTRPAWDTKTKDPTGWRRRR